MNNRLESIQCLEEIFEESRNFTKNRRAKVFCEKNDGDKNILGYEMYCILDLGVRCTINLSVLDLEISCSNEIKELIEKYISIIIYSQENMLECVMNDRFEVESE